MTTTNPTALKAQAIAARSGKRLATFIKDEIKKAGNAGDIRIDKEQLSLAKSRGDHLLRHDVPRKAYNKDGTEATMPVDLRDEHNPMHKDANGVLIAANYTLDDFSDKPNASPSPAQPLLAMREVWPVLATVPFMALAGVHWSITVAVLLAYAFFARPDDRSSFIGNLLYIVFGTSWKTAVFVAPVFLYLVFAAPSWLASASLPLWMCLKAHFWLVNRNGQTDPKGRAKALFGQVQHLTRTGYATQTDHEDKMHIAARQRQANAAAQDTSLLMDIDAQATGYFAGRGSLNSPDEGKNMVFTGLDLGAALLALGTTGTGKTYTVLLPIMRELARITQLARSAAERYGFFGMDDKGDLPPKGMAIFPNFKLISPEDYFDRTTGKTIKASVFAPMQGLNAEQVTQLIGDIFMQLNPEIWDKSARDKFLYTLIAMEFAISIGLHGTKVPKLNKDNKPTGFVKVKWTLESTFRLVRSDIQRKSLLEAIVAMDKRALQQGKPSLVKSHPLMEMAFEYFRDTYETLADNTRSSVNFNISAWVTDAVNRHMGPWMDAEEGVRVEDIFKGEAMGMFCPEFKYGITGRLMMTMVRARLYNFVKNRSSTWEEGGTRAVLMWDEVALGIGKGDMEANILPIARSLGLTCIFATQTITELRARMGKDRADALLDNLTKNIVCLATDAESYAYLATKLGTFRALVPSSRSKEAPVALDVYGTQRALDLAGTDGVTIYDQERLENKQTKAAKSLFTHGMLPNFEAMRGNKDADKLYKNVRDEDAYIRYIDAGLLSMEEQDIFNPAEMARLLAFNFHAFMLLNRGGARRFDLVHLGPKETVVPVGTPANDAVAKKTA